MKAIIFFSALVAVSHAFPGASRRDMLEQLKQARDLETRQGLVPSVSSLVNDVEGLLGSVAASVEPDNYRPQPGYEFQAPGPNDSRGPCPGLNLLANHGYLPRNGHVNFGQVVNATAQGFNMGADLSALLATFAVLTDGDIETESWYLGAGPGHVGGLNRHDTVEADISPNREDFYLGCGDNHHLSSRLFAQNVGFASQDPNKEFSLETMGNQYAAGAAFSHQNNPFLYYFPFPSIVSLGAFVFYPNFFSNGTYGAGGVANYESISSIVGAKFNEKTGDFEYVPERWPEQGWYRRADEYGAVITLAQALEYIYTKYPIAMAIPQLGSDNVTPQTILCNVYQGINSILPLALAGEARLDADAITWALGKLAAVGLSDTTLGCPKSAESADFLFPNRTVKGGPLNPPPSVQRNTGNNVYNKVYFPTAPSTPQCNAGAS